MKRAVKDLWDLLVARQFEKLGSPNERLEKRLAERGILTERALEQQREAFINR